MLITVGVIGLVTAIAIPQVGFMQGSANTATAKRNAQTLASIYADGEAAGIVWNNPAATKAQAVAAVLAGDTATNGTNFSVDGLSTDATTKAKPFLIYANGRLSFEPSGTDTGP